MKKNAQIQDRVDQLGGDLKVPEGERRMKETEGETMILI